ncbi:MAG TPA: competence/damage-inducible protein A [Candidatus Kapabacteria bacterium]|nr:competence/damage-inducible protein A [Candidatus Kapabacteria bacterium]
MYKISIITIGDEILNGQIINTNVAFISELLTEIGVNIVYHGTVGDNIRDIQRELNFAFQYSDFVITTGGLGPTDDDKTKRAVAEYFNDELKTSEPTLKHIINMLSEKGREISNVHKEQANIPSKSLALHNNVGTAPGIFIRENNQKIILLPGVPSEMTYLMYNEVLPIIQQELQKSLEEIIKFKTIITAGIYESKLAELIGAESNYPNGILLAYLPSSKGVRLRIGAKAKDFDTANKMIEDFENSINKKISPYVIGYGKEDIITYLAKLLRESKLTISVAESCTGGLLGATLTQIDGSSAYFVGGFQTYSNKSKEDLLNVPINILEAYGAVSAQTAEIMAFNTRNLLHTDIGISITGIAGPNGGTTDKPIGTVYIGYSDKYETSSKKFIFGNDRILNRERAVTEALLIIRDRILANEDISN